MTVVIGSDGRRLTLGPLLGKGGEGAVHQVVEAPDLAAKIYNSGKAKERRDKIIAMVSARVHSTSEFVAYPVDTLKSTTGDFVGFTMKKVSGFKSVHDLYGPGSRKVEFPTADSKFLVRAALNLAAAIASIHDTDCVIGDINHSGILVSDKALVTLIDSDSFQYRGPSVIYRCLVGVREYTPPELQGAPFAKIDRTANHDNFGLAVLLFQLLFLGRHPFSGKFLGNGDRDIQTAIREGRFAYSARRTETMMEPPPHVPSLSDYGEEIRKAFEAAFMPPARQPTGRPPASEWVRILRSYESSLQPCAVEKAHAYRPGLSSCPWCALEQGMGRSLFTAQYSMTSSVMDIGQLLSSIRSIPTPTPPPQAETVVPPLPELQISSAGQAVRKERTVTMIAGMAAMAIGLYLITAVQGFWGLLLLVGSAIVTIRASDLKARFAPELTAAQSHWAEQTAKWLDQAGPQKFVRRKNHYLELANTHSALPAKERQKLDVLEQRKRQLQLVKHMESHLIDRAKIKGIGQGRKATLASFGVENAWDVQQQNITSVPGFGPSLASDLLSWARSVERKFVFNASSPTDPRAIQDVKASIAKERVEIERELTNGPLELRRIADEAMVVRQKPPQSLIDAFAQLKQVERDMSK
ncbi:protein kinase domain-containing protein [Agrobacterium rhizogenes]|uniref:Kinase domain protein n=1 Tax=Rhizobium rhizogenes TaxID=359 RepID=A0A7S5DSU2_RHIRH|nr:protein kinase domain-containing protein [Rhizobium rhizogenes]NTF52979.1 protein kinase domain-containing protein [Rhizobium rhizogenes]NTH10189.1 protein kinase domain-containing protein [Rhizobium rhizogenes]NTI06748.1 protein kinase domain-containing protein [Rhizobium rhizogenes]NTI13553.1 protein kinase domain-containing protein [Rhizobium rhizogenes]NTJ51877.1 protein kinase domain-containing protein [Rhizobium rhizogenes]